MRFERLFLAAAVAALSATLHAQVQTGSTAIVNADGGYVAIQTGTTPWQGMTSVAANATINLQTQAIPNNDGGGEGEGGGGGIAPDKTAFKFSNTGGTLAPATYSDSTSFNGGTSATSGASRITSSTTAPTYYSAGWGGIATSPTSGGTAGQLSGTGTYDPWSITYRSLYDAGATAGSTAHLSYQTGFLQTGIYGPTGAFASGNGVAYYNFQATAEDAGATAPSAFVAIYYTAGFTPFFSCNPGTEFDIYLLGANAQDPNASPSDRTGAADAQKLDRSNIDGILSPYFGANGTLTRDLNFGFVRRYTVPSLPSGASLDDTLFAWHTDTFASTSVAPVPEPSSIAALGLGAAALLRRRKRA